MLWCMYVYMCVCKCVWYMCESVFGICVYMYVHVCVSVRYMCEHVFSICVYVYAVLSGEHKEGSRGAEEGDSLASRGWGGLGQA